MIEKISRLLVESGHAGSEHAIRYAINITVGESMAVSAYTSPEVFFQIKASEFIDVEPEYRALCEARRVYGALVPEPVACRRDGEWSIMVSEGVPHTAVTVHDLFAGRLADTLVRQLMTVFEIQGAARAATAASGPRAYASLVQDARRWFEASRFRDTARPWLDRADSAGLARLGWVPQHGDLVVNNLGCRDRSLVVFDWEDYGKVGLVGLDVFTLYLTICDLEFDAVRALARPDGALRAPVESLLRRACEALGLGFDAFRAAAPLYLLIFLYLKRNYGVPVQDRLGQLLGRLDDPGPAVLVRPAALPG